VESINHPAHYGGDTFYEAIKVIEAWGLCFHTGNAVKYIARAGKKDPSKEAEDLRKAIWYLERKIAALEQRRRARPVSAPKEFAEFAATWPGPPLMQPAVVEPGGEVSGPVSGSSIFSALSFGPGKPLEKPAVADLDGEGELSL
jgi:hypothetical protein